jgi:flavin reductase (DIM6/NTAB) family NADH-FMN oxidoreductase RutF
MEIDPSALDRTAAYRLLTTALVPRPVAWVGTRSSAGVDNLAPFSYFMGVSTTPLLVAFSAARLRDGARKHTASNLLDTGVCTLSIPEQADLDVMHASSAPWEGSEFEALELARVDGVVVAAPRPAQVRVAMEGRLHQHLDLGQVDLFLVEVVHFHVDDALWTKGLVDPHGFDPVARLGGEFYAALGERHPRAPATIASRPNALASRRTE